jgi:UTP--glucose-1-phosphate uridylyltransferase
MSESGLQAATAKMREAEVPEAAIAVFAHYYGALESGATGLIHEDEIEPLVDLPQLADLPDDEAAARAALAQTVVIKLNGGLGTSMGMDRAKVLLPVRDGRTFLDLIVDQVRTARREHDVPLPLVFMHSFRTRQDTLAALAAHPDIVVDGLPLDFVQSQEPKLTAADLAPVQWPADPALEWCPPGHGDFYPSILASGLLDALLDAGFRYANVSNCDNLGATPDGRIAAWFAASGAPYAAEVCPRTPADRKGGHLARRRSDGQLVLRDTAQTAPEDLVHFMDESRHRYVHTNNLWLDLAAVRRELLDRGAVLGLPLIRNAKTVDPTDPASPAVIQIETAVGAAIGVFDGAAAIVVGRDRFLPVKTTNDLLLLRSDAYQIGSDAVPRLVAPQAALVDLDPEHYRTIAGFDRRFPAGPPSLRAARSLTVRGDWSFGTAVAVAGDVVLDDHGTPQRLPDGAALGG